jgi:hypothetical protein
MAFSIASRHSDKRLRRSYSQHLVQRYAGDAWGDGELLIGAGFDPCLYPLEHSSVRSLADTVRYDCRELLIDAASQPTQFLADLGFW